MIFALCLTVPRGLSPLSPLYYPLPIPGPSPHLVYDILLYDITFLCSENRTPLL